MESILVTPRSLTQGGDPALDRLSTAGYRLVFSPPGVQPGERELAALLRGCVGYLAGVETISAGVIASAASLRVISRNGSGIDNIDLEACRSRGIRVLRAEGANAEGVAELTIGLLLDLARSITHSSGRLKAGSWERRKGFELPGRSLGIVGCGRVGRAVARSALAFGMEVRAFDPYPDAGFAPGLSFRYTSLEELLARSDVVTLHAPPREDGRAVIDGAGLLAMKPGACLINTARAELVDDRALLEALESGRLLGYATDVFEKEPPGATPLLAHERVIATPHIGGFTEESVSRVTRAAVENLLLALEGARR